MLFLSDSESEVPEPEPEPETKPISARVRVSMWCQKLREFNEKHQNICCEPEDRVGENCKKEFPTSSKYEGSWNSLGMNGHGTFIFPNGAKYVGGFKDNLFDGQATMHYPEAFLEGIWFTGLFTEPKLFVGVNKLEYDYDDWAYCKIPDRRFEIEFNHSIQPSTKSFLTNAWEPRKIPDGCYDTEDGFYDPKTGYIYYHDDMTRILSKPTKEYQQWIKNNCRCSNDDPVGPRLDLYEHFCAPQEFLETESFQTSYFEGLKDWRGFRAVDVTYLRNKYIHEQTHADLNQNQLDQLTGASRYMIYDNKQNLSDICKGGSFANNDYV